MECKHSNGNNNIDQKNDDDNNNNNKRWSTIVNIFPVCYS